MNTFVLLACIGFLAHFASARPDLSLGYRYNQGHSSSGSDFLQAPTSNGYFNSAPNAGQSFYQQYNGGSVGSYPSQVTNNAQFTSGSTSTSNSVNYAEQQEYINHLQQHQVPVVTKHFYLHSAPEDHDDQQIVRYINVGQPQKNYRVVFIDAPSSSASKAKIIANVAPVEDKTAIYVLSKKSSALDVSAEVVTPAPVTNKPEVFFIKYNTPEEAIHAQHTIQSQYDALGGSSDVTNEGTVPVTSVIGSLNDATSHVHGFDGVNSEQTQNVAAVVNVVHTGDNTQQTYLPSHQRN